MYVLFPEVSEQYALGCTSELRTQPGKVQVMPEYITEGTGRNEIVEDESIAYLDLNI